MPSGDAPDPAYAEYTDEWGEVHRDGLIIPLGRLHSTTPGSMYHPSTAPDKLKPLRSGRQLLANRGLLSVVVNPDEGGRSASILLD